MAVEVTRFRKVSIAEGLSYVALLGIAMPLKYAAGYASAVRVVGMVHGLLFIAFVLALASAASAGKWSLKRTAIAFLAALVPLGAFWLERQLRREQLVTGS